MKNIDFLPQRYQERGANERARLWQFALVGAIGLAIVAAAVWQGAAYRAVDAQIAAIEPQYQQAQAKTQRVAELNQRLARDGALAELLTYLRHPWPRSQLLATLARQLSPELTLTEIRLVRESPERPVVVREQPAPGAAGTPAAPPPPGAVQDLTALRVECDNGPLVLLVAGEATDTAALHDYLGRLKKSHLFARAELASITSKQRERSPTAAAPKSEFHLRLVLLPGYGQPGGPTAPAADPNPLAGTTAPGDLRPSEVPEVELSADDESPVAIDGEDDEMEAP